MRKYFLLMITVFITAGCLQTENSSNGDASLAGSANFIAANAIMNNNCANCHNYAELTEAQLIASGDSVAGDAFNSPIYNRLRGSTAPTGTKNMPQSTSLTTDQVTQIYTWIQGITP
ncbi:MAG: hypothetical protein IT287_09540 [Bdellovibrionaceae bacterium]|nr:hypothetical protein [Pseudobdellovibrionaceae bacterium]